MIVAGIPFGSKSNKRIRHVLRTSPLFDELWYARQNQDVGSMGLDPITHYLDHGSREGRQPNPLFDPAWYISQYPFVKIEPLIHYIKYGSKKGLRPSPLFDPVWYLANNPDVAAKQREPLAHYLEYGRREGRKPNPLFDPSWYLSTNKDVAALNEDPVYHYLRFGWKERRCPNPIFDPDWYLTNNPDVASSHIEPLTHYLEHGIKEGRHFAPNILEPFPTDIHDPLFSEVYGKNLLEHSRRLLEEEVLGVQGSICFLVPERFSALNKTEGFCQRVSYIDNLLCLAPRIYINIVPSEDRFDVPSKVGADIWEYVAYENNDRSLELLEFLISRSNTLYAHSIYALRSNLMRDFASRRGGSFVIDLHGAVPEEEQLMGNKDYSDYLEDVERNYLPLADCMVVVSRAMANLYAKKYNLSKTMFSYVPFLPSHGVKLQDEREDNLVVYCGGNQKWQLLPEMLTAMNVQLNRYNFSVFSADYLSISGLAESLSLNKEFLNRVPIKQLPHSEMLTAIQKASYGFVLRENSVINRIACPTKMIEYIECGVVPILQHTDIGDFKEFGLCYVTVSDFMGGQMPTAEECRHMAGVNLWVLRKMRAAWEEGIRALFGLVYANDERPALLIDNNLKLRVKI